MRRHAVAAVGVALLVAGCGGGGSDPEAAERQRPPRGVVADCAGQSSAGFPGAFSHPRNLVVGPLALMGGAAYTPPDVVREFGGNKFPLLVLEGHRVTVEVPRALRKVVALGYGPLPQGHVSLRDGHAVVRFVACRRRSASRADGRRVTFWSGFVLTSGPRCVPLRVWVDDEPAPRPAVIRLGERHCRPPAPEPS